MGRMSANGTFNPQTGVPKRPGQSEEHDISEEDTLQAPVPAALAAVEWTADRARVWRHWLAGMLVAAGLAMHVRRRDGQASLTINYVYIEEHGISRQILYGWVRYGRQPSLPYARKLATMLGLHPFAVMFRAGLIVLEDLAEMLGAALQTPEEIEAELAGFALLRDEQGHLEGWLADVERQTERRLQQVREIQAKLGLSNSEYGAIAAEMVRREIHLDQQAFHTEMSAAADMELRAAIASMAPTTAPNDGVTLPEIHNTVYQPGPTLVEGGLPPAAGGAEAGAAFEVDVDE